MFDVKEWREIEKEIGAWVMRTSFNVNCDCSHGFDSSFQYFWNIDYVNYTDKVTKNPLPSPFLSVCSSYIYEK